MGRFSFRETRIKDLFIVEIDPFKDDRGYFMETYNEEEFFKAGLRMKFVQNNESFSTKGVLRGLHFQKKFPQGKLIRCVEGEVFDVAVDLRPKSSTYGEWESIRLKENDFKQFYIPEGFAHGFLVLSDTARFLYSVTNFYHKDDEGGLFWNDPDLSINWPIGEGLKPILSEKDKQNPLLKDLERMV